MVEAHIHCRVAAPNDAAGIFRVLTEVAPEIPLLIDTKERQKAVSSIVDKCIAAGELCVATDGGGMITGFILVGPDEMERFHHDNQALHLRYAGVAKACRRHGIFRALIQQVMNSGRTANRYRQSSEPESDDGTPPACRLPTMVR